MKNKYVDRALKCSTNVIQLNHSLKTDYLVLLSTPSYDTDERLRYTERTVPSQQQVSEAIVEIVSGWHKWSTQHTTHNTQHTHYTHHTQASHTRITQITHITVAVKDKATSFEDHIFVSVGSTVVSLIITYDILKKIFSCIARCSVTGVMFENFSCNGTL